MIKLLKSILPANHETTRVIEVLESMELLEWVKALVITGTALIVLPMVILIWDVREAIA